MPVDQVNQRHKSAWRDPDHSGGDVVVIVSHDCGVLTISMETGLVHMTGCDSSVVATRRAEFVAGVDDLVSKQRQVWSEVTLVAADINAVTFARAAQHFRSVGAGVAFRLMQQDAVVAETAFRAQQQSRIAHPGMVIPMVSNTAITRDTHTI